MATSTEPENYEVLETIGEDLTFTRKYGVAKLIFLTGRGSFGTIRKVRRISDGHVSYEPRNCEDSTSTNKHPCQILCRKEIQYIKMSQKEREQLHAEFSILNSLKHPNIVGYYHREHLKPTQELYLYMEYCGGGDLSKEILKLKEKSQYADEEYVWSIFSQLIAALYRCHYGINAPEVGRNAMGPCSALKPLGLKGKNQVMILHRDLKPENSKFLVLYCAWLNTDCRSLSRRRQFGQAWRFWIVKTNAIPRLRFDICRNAILHVARDMCCRTVYPPLGYLVSWMRYVRALCADSTFQRQNSFSFDTEDQRRSSGSAAQRVLSGATKRHQELLEH